jgi:hypothetical protein
VTDRLDVGVDVMGVQHSDDTAFTGKVAGRYSLSQHFRLEGGIGAADDSFGKSLNADLGLTTGTLNPEATWNYYASLRLAGSHGYPGSVLSKAATQESQPGVIAV